MSAPDWSLASSTVENAFNNSTVIFESQKQYVSKKMDAFYKSTEFAELMKKGYNNGGDYSELQNRVASVKQSAMTDYSKRSLTNKVTASRGRGIVALAEIGIGLGSALWEYY
ncbi:MAG: hypothetical protein RL154_1164, partial [Pseudomonadota bacterium]